MLDPLQETVATPVTLNNLENYKSFTLYSLRLTITVMLLWALVLCDTEYYDMSSLPEAKNPNKSHL